MVKMFKEERSLYMFEIKFRTGNAAFNDEMTGEPDLYIEALECQRILQDVIKKLEAGYCDGSCIDLNGNKVGTWQLK